MREYQTVVRELNQLRARVSIGEPNILSLPRFDPSAVGADPAAWCSATSLLSEDHPLRGSELFSVLTRALESSAAQWLTQVLTKGDVTWPVLRERFLARYGGKDTAATSLTKMFEEQPLQDELPGAFGSRLPSLLDARWQGLIYAEIVNGTVLYRLDLQDQHFKRLALANNIKTEDQFQYEMNLLSYGEEPMSSSASPEAKRRRPSEPRARFSYCGFFRHRMSEGRRKLRT
jgi:hypothetical protein